MKNKPKITVTECNLFILKRFCNAFALSATARLTLQTLKNKRENETLLVKKTSTTV